MSLSCLSLHKPEVLRHNVLTPCSHGGTKVGGRATLKVGKKTVVMRVIEFRWTQATWFTSAAPGRYGVSAKVLH